MKDNEKMRANELARLLNAYHDYERQLNLEWVEDGSDVTVFGLFACTHPLTRSRGAGMGKSKGVSLFGLPSAARKAAHR